MPTPTTASKTNADKLAAAIAKSLSGGELLGEVNIVRQGDQIILPSNMEEPEAITWLQRKIEADNTVSELNEFIDGFPLDVAHALALATKEMFGFKSMADFWPKSISLEIDSEGNTVQVYVGAFKVPGIDGTITTKSAGATKLNVQAAIKQKDQPKLKALIDLTRRKLQTDSVYRGKAFELEFDPRNGNPLPPKFIRTIRPGQFQGNADVLGLLEGVWTLIRETERCRDEKIPLKRGVLLEGPYGTGKSLFGAETAALTTKHGWTFILLKDVNWLAHAYEFAQFYAPAVLFSEDIDVAVDPSTNELSAHVRNTIDGVNTKRAEVLLLLTTNYPERLPKSVLRPGRLDVVIPFRKPDAPAIERLLRQYGGERISSAVQVGPVAQALANKGSIPATVREVVERAKIHMVSRRERFLSARDLELAAESMLHHMNLFEGAMISKPSFAEQWGESMGHKIGEHVATALLRAKRMDDGYLDSDAEAVITDRPLEAASEVEA